MTGLRVAAGALLAIAASSVLAQPAPTCRERKAALDERRGLLQEALAEAKRESDRLDNRSRALDAERATLEGSGKKQAISEYNERALAQKTSADAHNARLAALNGDVEQLNRDLDAARLDCVTPAPDKPPAPNKAQ